MLFLVYSRPALLKELRAEIARVVDRSDSKQGNHVNRLDITSLKKKCPLLVYASQEVLRYHAMGTSIRQVMQDTLLDGQWLLKKDAMIQIPSVMLHSDASLWGVDVEEFDPPRFMEEQSQTKDGAPRKRPQPTVLQAFGGGTTLCPGRHFATSEVLAMTSMFILRYDLRPAKGGWRAPSVNNTNTAAVITEPDTDVEVEVVKRQHGLEASWEVWLSESKNIVAKAAEDPDEENQVHDSIERETIL